ncbi:MAG: hypothetical protein JWN14_3968, partial [Chthonomonadales bacterium]|nr:hypothetical protein [Chthonomonadales bacterium]
MRQSILQFKVENLGPLATGTMDDMNALQESLITERLIVLRNIRYRIEIGWPFRLCGTVNHRGISSKSYIFC